MKLLKFSNPVFNQDINLTVRKGVKWSIESGLVYLSDENGNIKGKAEIEYTKAIPFKSLRDEDLQLEHDPECRDKKGLFHELQRVYGVFEEREIVSMVFFRMLNNEQEVQEPRRNEDAKSDEAGNKNPSQLDNLLEHLTKNDTEKQKKELEIYDKMKFTNANPLSQLKEATILSAEEVLKKHDTSNIRWRGQYDNVLAAMEEYKNQEVQLLNK